jgi:predicted RNA binding protein YcfA (HicA-like mRNA interferase family)
LYKGLKHTRTKGGHEIWSRSDLTRPVVIQTHENPVPEHIIKNNLRTINSDRKDFEEWLNPTPKKEIVGAKDETIIENKDLLN